VKKYENRKFIENSVDFGRKISNYSIFIERKHEKSGNTIKINYIELLRYFIKKGVCIIQYF
jgi:hypothetical protein